MEENLKTAKKGVYGGAPLPNLVKAINTQEEITKFQRGQDDFFERGCK